MGVSEFFLILVFSLPVLVCLVLAVQAWSRRHVPGSAALSMMMFGVVLYTVPYFLQITSHDLQTALLWHAVSTPGAAILAPAWLIFALRYTGNERWLNVRLYLFLVLVILFDCFTVWSNPWLGLDMRQVRLVQYGPFSILQSTRGWGYWLLVVIFYVLSLLGMALLVKSALQQFKLQQRQALFLLAGVLLPIAVHASFLLGFSSFHGLDVTPFVFSISGLLWGYGIFRYKLLDVLPLARETVVEQMKIGVVVLDHKQRVVDLNPAARHLLGKTAEEAAEKPAQEALPFLQAFQNLDDLFKQSGTEISFLMEGQPRWALVQGARLYDLGNRQRGSLLMLQDITPRKCSEMQLKESEEKLRAILDHLQDGIAVADRQGKLVTWNKKLEEMLEVSAQELQGKMLWEVTQMVHSPHVQASVLSEIHRTRVQEMLGSPQSFTEGLSFQTAELYRSDGSRMILQVDVFGIPVGGEMLMGVTVRDITEMLDAEAALQQANERLTCWLAELEMRSEQADLLNQIGARLLASSTEDEALAAMQELLPKVFRGISGGIYLLHPEENLLKQRAAWGQGNLARQIRVPPGCQALRERVSHRMDDFAVGSEDPFRQSDCNSQDLVTLCTPLVHLEDSLGVLLLHFKDPAQEARLKQVARGVADRLTLALVNLRLRQSLYKLSIHDPLTNLYNRRFMQEAMEREISRAQRRHHAMSIMMIDIDHFKRFNDTFGHPAGDVMLKSLAAMFLKNIRMEDIACRYGGEEFVIIMPDTIPVQAFRRAEELRQEAAALQVMAGENNPQSVTISVGVSGYPHHGDTITEVLIAADHALYRAKQEGRNTVRLAGE